MNTHRKINLQDAQVSAKYREQFKQLCKEFEDIFSKDSTDIGKTSLITMDIDTGDSPPPPSVSEALQSATKTQGMGAKGVRNFGKDWGDSKKYITLD